MTLRYLVNGFGKKQENSQSPSSAPLPSRQGSCPCGQLQLDVDSKLSPVRAAGCSPLP